MTVDQIARSKAEQALNVIRRRYPMIDILGADAVGFAQGVVHEAIVQGIEQWHAIGPKPKPSKTRKG